MAFDRPPLNDLFIRIQNDIISRLTGLIPLLSRALLKILAWVLSGAWDSVYGNQEFVGNQITVGTASDTWVRRYAFQWDVPIQEATFAGGTYKFTGTNGSTIPLNTILVRDDNIEYITITTGDIGDIISGEISLEIECRTAGLIGNADGNTPLALVSPIIGVDTAGTLIGDGAEGGVDADTTEQIRDNVLDRMKLPPMGGSSNDYRVVCEGVAGVDKAFTFPNQANQASIPASVTCVIRGVAPLVPSAGLLADVLTALNDSAFKPIVATHFTAPIEINTVSFGLTINPDTPEIQANIEKNLTDMFDADAFPGQNEANPPEKPNTIPILISHIRNAISTSGVIDYEITSITTSLGGAQPVDQDLNFENFEYAILGDIVY